MASKKGKRIVPDDDIPEMTKADFAVAKSLKAEMPDVVEAFAWCQTPSEQPQQIMSSSQSEVPPLH